MRAALPVLLVLASSAAAAPKLPAHYAKLFQPKATWTYQLAPADATSRPDVTCTVARTITIGKVVASEITCDHELTVAGIYLATPAGLYRADIDFPATEADLDRAVGKLLLVQAKPRALARPITKVAPTTPITRVVTTFGVRREGKEWCWYRTTEWNKKRRQTDTLCFADGIAHGLDHELAFRVR